MPLNRPALSLGPGPRGVQDARRWVVEVCTDIGRSELAECAELGVSELVTNALLHGRTPVTVRVRGTKEHPRVEVRDASPEPPLLPTLAYDDEDDDDLLVTFGRGLSIVARCSTAWGADLEEDGKVVWFTPAAEPADDPVDGVVTGTAAREDRPRAGEGFVEIELHGVPLRLFFGFQAHYRELRREVRLLALAHENDYPLAKTLSDHFGALDRQLSEGIGAYQIDEAVRSRRNRTDLRVAIAPRTARPPWAGSSSCSISPTPSAATSACCRWRAPRSSARSSAGSWASSSGSRPTRSRSPGTTRG